MSEELFWTKLIQEASCNHKLVGSTCAIYSESRNDDISIKNKQCICGRDARRHSYNGKEPVDPPELDDTWEKFEHARSTSINVYGVLQNQVKFVRFDHTRKETSLHTIGQKLCADRNGEDPTLLISCYGGAKYFKMNDKLEKEFMIGIGQAAATKGVWLLTTGLNSGVSKVIGQSVWKHKVLADKSTDHDPTVIGLTSWGCLSSRTRDVLRRQAKLNTDEKRTRRDSIVKMEAPLKGIGYGIHYANDSLVLDEKETDTIDTNHTHLILLDDGSEGDHSINKDGEIINDRFYIDDQPRSRFIDNLIKNTKIGCYSVTIIIEGGLDSLEVISNDLDATNPRPVLIVGGSGRLANILTDLLESIQYKMKLSDDEIDRYLKKIDSTKDLKRYRNTMKNILKEKYRPYLNIFKLDDRKKFTDALFSVVFKAAVHSQKPNQTTDDRSNLLSESLKKLLKISVEWNYIDGIDYIFEEGKTIDDTLTAELLESALKNNRPAFVDYFLRRQYNVLQNHEQLQKILTTTQDCQPAFIQESLIKELYKSPIAHLKKSDKIEGLFDLDRLYYRLIGPYSQSFMHTQSTMNRFKTDIKDLWIVEKCKSSCCSNTNKVYGDNKETISMNSSNTDNEKMLRDLFLWAVISGHAEMAFIILLQVKCRLVASLLAAGIINGFRLKTTGTGYSDEWHEFENQSKTYEHFAKSCINHCYQQNEQRACELLAREIPLFGNITCMQVAVHFRLQTFINSRCFDQVLNRQWNGTLSSTTNQTLSSVIYFATSIIFIGLPAPFLLEYRNDYSSSDKEKLMNEKDSTLKRRWEGIQDKHFDELDYGKKLRQFHRAPVVRMTYDFIFYTWMLLVFSYMMLFQMKIENPSIHWTEIYVIITISAMLIEDIRRVFMEYYTQMVERWHRSDLWLVLLYVLPYILYYIGIGLKYASINRPDLFTAARIVLALDLELWFLFSLRFVSAIKLLGPKLFMIRNMLRDLVAFIYIIFVCIAAYGVVSRSLIMYDRIDFTMKSISTAILYRPYWFLYSIVDDESNDLNNITESTSSSTDAIAEATTTQILLTFHMLFINILLLNLLIAVFNFTINDVQDKSEYLWRYQRYELIREYFEKPSFAYPPLSLLVYGYSIFKYIFFKENAYRVFKRSCTSKMNKDWTDFEYVATSNYARTFVDRMYRDSSTLNIPSSSDTDEVKIEIESLKRQNEEMRHIIEKTDVQSQKMASAMNWMMQAMDRVRMSAERPAPLLNLRTSNHLFKEA